MSEQPNERVFDEQAEEYEALIDWPRRLARETPFYRALFERVGARRVLDVACGTGHHAALFHSWGLAVEGADISPGMLARCRQRSPEDDRLRWVQRSFEQPAVPPGSFDVAICVGNSLAIAADLPAAARVLAAMLASVRAGGAIVVQVLNLWRFPEGPIDWQKCRRIVDARGDRVLLRGIHRIGPRGYANFVTLDLANNDVTPRPRAARLLGFEAGPLRETARAAGAADVLVFGDYEQSEYRRDTSQDLILIASRAPRSLV